MTILYAITALFELVLLLALTGILASVVAVLRLMELTISIIHPFTIFMLRQSGRIIIFGARQTKMLASHAYSRIHVDRGRVTATGLLTINMRQPETPYYRSTIPSMVEETFPRECDFVLIRSSREKEEAEVDRERVTATGLLTINMRQPETPYYRSTIPGMVEETFPRECDFGPIRASREVKVHSPSVDLIEETDDGKVGEDESRKSIEENTSEATTVNNSVQ